MTSRQLIAHVAGFLTIMTMLFTTKAALAQDSPCSAIREHASDTVIVLRPPSTFTICRAGSIQDDVVTGRPVYFEVLPTPGSSMFDFRIHGQGTEWTPTGLVTWWTQTRHIAERLHDIEHSSETVSEIVVPSEVPSSSAMQDVAAARSRYLGVVTPKFIDALGEVRTQGKELPIIASVVGRWCAELSADTTASAAALAELKATCSGPELQAGALNRDLSAFVAAAAAFDDARGQARERAIEAVSRPQDAHAAADAVHALDHARAAANATVEASRALGESSDALAHDVRSLRGVIGSVDAIRPGVPTYLSTYSAAGNAELEVDAMPVDISTVSESAKQQTAGKTTARFPVIARHYLDIEAGLGVTAGLPPIPTVVTQSNASVIQSKPVDEFVGLALVELEPARFLWPDLPIAGLLRLPVIGIPFTRDPTQNFFIGAGIGWTGIGSISAGPYLLRELSLRSGYAVDERLPAGTSLDGATDAALKVGYFASASVDLLGLFHLFVPSHAVALDAVTGKEK